MIPDMFVCACAMYFYGAIDLLSREGKVHS